MKAVIMTDTFQAIVLVVSLFALVMCGQYVFGGSISDVYNIAYKSGRVEFFKYVKAGLLHSIVTYGRSQ